MKKIIYTRADGVLMVVTPNEGFRLATSIKLSGGKVAKAIGGASAVDQIVGRWPIVGAVAAWAETEEQWIGRVMGKDVPKDARDVQVIAAEALPFNRKFRNAWKAGNGRVEHDMTKCREIHRTVMRQVRAPKLAALDVEFMRAVEAGDTAKQAAVATQKKALRDVTRHPAIDAAQTPEQLLAAWPVELGERPL